MRSTPRSGMLAAGMVVIGGLLGVAVIGRPGVAIPFTVELSLLAMGTGILISRERDPAVSKWLFNLIAGALAVRLALGVAIHFGPGLSPYFFAPDALQYEGVGREFANYWGGSGTAPARISEGWRQSYWYLNGAFTFVFNESSLALVTLNIFAGLWTVLLTFSMTRELLNVEAAKVTALLTAFFPSLVLWSVLNIRDSLATLTVVLMVWAGIRLSRRVRGREVAALLIGLVALAALRDYMAFLVLSGLLVGSFASVRPNRMAGSLFMGTLVALLLTYVAGRLDLFSSLRPEDVLGTAENLRTGLQANSGSAFGVGASTTTVGGALQYLPVGAAFLLFAPFPWAIESPLQLVAMPETLLWYPLFIFAVRGLMLVQKRPDNGSVMVPLSVLLIVTASYALVEGNFGTAYRHRAQLMPLFFIFSGMGLTWFSQRVLSGVPWSRRARAAASRRRRANTPGLVRRRRPPPSGRDS